MMPVSLTRRGWGFALSAVGLCAIWLVIGLRDLWYLVALLLAMLVIALIAALLLASLARFEVQLSTTDSAPVAGDHVTLTAVIRHRLPLAVRYRIVWTAGDDVFVMPLDVGGTGRDRHLPSTSRIDWHAARRGPTTVRVAGLLALDPLGLAVCRSRTPAAVELLVLPRLLPALAEGLADTWQGPLAEELTSSRAALHDAGSPAGAVREYRSGDPQRQIHWKQSARQGELLVNLHETSETVDRSLLLITARDAYGTETGFELAVAAAATLAVRWLRRGYPVRLRLGDSASVTCATEGEALRQLALAGKDEAETPSEGGHPETPIAGRTAALRAAPNAVVTGSVTARLAEQLGGMAGAGILLALRRAPDARVPESWHEVSIPRPGGERDAPAGTGFSSAEAEAAHG